MWTFSVKSLRHLVYATAPSSWSTSSKASAHKCVPIQTSFSPCSHPPIFFNLSRRFLQTIAVLRQAWQDRLRPILIVNKLDRLITELKLSPSEAHHHLVQLIENVNAVVASFYAGERMEDDLRWREERERRLAKRNAADLSRIEDEASGTTTTSGTAKEKEKEGDDADEEFAERTDEDIYFAPERGNVVFASAIDGWAFRLGKFAQLYAQKLGVNEANLRRALWGDFYLDPKTKRILSSRQLKGRKGLKPLFVQFVLDNIWAVYENVVVNPFVLSSLLPSSAQY